MNTAFETLDELGTRAYLQAFNTGPRVAEALESRVEDDAGVAAAEYLGVIFVIGAIIAALLQYGDPIASALKDQIINAINAIKG